MASAVWQRAAATAGGVVMLVGLCATGGCAAIFVHGPPSPPPPPPQPVSCTESRVAPWIDTSIAVGLLLESAAIALEPCNKEDFGCIGKVLLLPLVPLGVGYGVSAIWGHTTVSTCRKLRHPEPPPAALPPPAMAATPGTAWIGRPGHIGPTGADVRTAPHLVAPLLVRVAPGQSVLVLDEVNSGWRRITLPDGRVGYVRGDEVRVDTGPPIYDQQPLPPAP